MLDLPNAKELRCQQGAAHDHGRLTTDRRRVTTAGTPNDNESRMMDPLQQLIETLAEQAHDFAFRNTDAEAGEARVRGTVTVKLDSEERTFAFGGNYGEAWISVPRGAGSTWNEARTALA